MDIGAVRQKAIAAIRPLKSAGGAVGGMRMKAGDRLPDYYLVYFLLVDLLGFHNIGQGEKVAWALTVSLRGQQLSIEHRKFGVGVFSWDGDAAEAAAAEALRLINRGVKVAQAYFDWRACQGRRENRPHGGVKMYHPGIAVQRNCHP